MAKKIMIIDDESDFQEIYTTMLEGRGYNLTYAYDGNEAMQMLENDIPDLIILDMVMDMVTGDTFFLHLKGFQKFSNVPIIVISSMPQKQYKDITKIDPTLVYINKAKLTKEKLLEEIDNKLEA
ncbi:MAG: response regulator [Candidatus Scalindua rubra]|uniref:Two-component response regulator n=1 Tax=Candidatus Scalindua brodae TaxID=237368 RepID=A0A0B0EKA7_9BACT|nr:MAG: two-component response regulator [Candidatus Scalindua brodae]MBZ0107601.1 response regulator [Candidatus Scalindua rubra]